MKRFTLVEGLIVFIIIALMIAILLSAMNMAREKTRKTACLNCLSQIGKAIHCYGADWNELLPGTASELINLAEYSRLPAALFLCPSDFYNKVRVLGNGFLNRDDSISASYMYANHYRDSKDDFSLKSRYPARIAIEWDLYAGSNDLENADKRNHNVHGGNVLYLDGHALWKERPLWAFFNRPEFQ